MLFRMNSKELSKQLEIETVGILDISIFRHKLLWK
jgi:hypothetical protein